MHAITANELKINGISAIEGNLADGKELVITVRGKDRYVVMDIKQYNYFRECELETALHESRKEYEAGNYTTESVDEHVKRVTE